MTNIAIRVQNLSKCFQIYSTPRDRLKQFIFPRMQRVAGQTPKQYFREFWALKDISFEIKKGETVGIVGRNGSGKSTLLQLICGTLTPTHGTAETNGRVAALLELGAGFNPEFTGRENVYMNATIMGLKEEEIDAKFEEISAFAEIGEFIERPVKTLSSGMYVRLAFAVQVCVDPEILIVDEALAVGDAYFVHRCFNRLREMKERGKTIIFVSHDATSVQRMCDRAFLLETGAMVFKGKPDVVIAKYRASMFGFQKIISDAIPVLEAASMKQHDDQPLQFGQLPPEHNIPNIDRRMGAGRCLIQGVGIYDAITLTPVAEVVGGAEFILRITVMNISVDEEMPLIVGYNLLGTHGEDVCGVNTLMEPIDIFAPAKGSCITVRVKITLPYLAQGNYALTVAVKIDEAASALAEDRVENAIVFGVRSPCNVIGQMRLQTGFVLEK